ncbi:hypothetical protein N7456_007701 [Penicillium angulare]|uniref:Uncharacterized protein n=1 Tax=Penicillium angulare TaxID=116970 RepID=A0A9W9FB66_9EURO|nr:hypothetical protein N7456_007701 [Penicillium angulare]
MLLGHSPGPPEKGGLPVLTAQGLNAANSREASHGYLTFSGAPGENAEDFVTLCRLRWKYRNLSPEECNRAQLATLRSGLRGIPAEFVADSKNNDFETLSRDLIHRFPFVKVMKKGGPTAKKRLQHQAQANRTLDEYVVEAFQLRSETPQNLEPLLVKHWAAGIDDTALRDCLLKEFRKWQEDGESCTLERMLERANNLLDL